MRRRWRPADGPLRVALGALLCGAAGAQVCAWPAEVMDIRVGASARGEWLTRRSPDGQVWLERAALRAAERGYVQEDVPCADGDGALIRPGVTWTADEAALQLTLTPNLAFLPVTTRAAPWPSGTLPADQGGQVVTAPVHAELSGDLSGVRVATLGARPSLQRGPALLSSELDLRAEGGTVTATGALGARLQGPGVTVGAQVRRDASGLSVAAQLSAAHLTARTLPPLSIPLPLGGEVTVQVEGDASVPFTADPGTLVLTGVPIPDWAGSATVTVRDDGGVRTIRTAFPASLHPMHDGDWHLKAAATAGSGGGSAQVQGALVSGPWLWTADGTWAGQLSGAVTATYRDGLRTLGLSAGLRNVQQDTRALFGVAYQTQGLAGRVAWTAGARATWGAPEDRRAGVNLGLSGDRWLARASGDWTPRGATVGASGQWQVRPDLQVRAGGTWGPSQRAWQLGVSWQLSPVMTADATVGTERNVTVTVRPDDTWTLQAQVGGAAARASVTGGAAAQVRAAVSTGGPWQAAVSSVLVSTAGVSRWTRAGSSVLLVHTGIPDLPVFLDGAPAGRTDRQGTLLLPDVPPGTRHTLSVRVDDLPIEVTVRDHRLVFTQAQSGTSLDWRANFTRLRPVTFFVRAGQPAAFGTVRAAGQEWFLDDLGRALLPAQGGEGQLLVDGVTCPVQWTAAAEAATCAAVTP